MPWKPRQRVLVPFDFSDHSHRAIDMALDMVDVPEHIHVLHVLPFLIPTEPGVVWATVDDVERIEHATSALRDEFKEAKYSGIQCEVRIGSPGVVITDRAAELGADLIVLPSHGRTGLTRLLIGSVAEQVVRLAKCPVLVVKITGDLS